MKINYILVLFSIFASRCKMTTKGFKVKLSESTLRFAGQVMINHPDGKWTSICGYGWNKMNARVVCRQLDFSGAEAAISGDAFGAAPGAIAAKRFYCNGNETSLSECNSFNTSISCNNNTVASVLCTPPPDFVFPDFLFPLIIMIGCLLAITLIIILVLTCKIKALRRQNENHRNSRSLIAKSSEIGFSNLNTEDIIESSSKREDGRLNKKSETLATVFSGSDPNFPCSTLPDTELMVTSDERAHGVDGNEGQIASPLTDAELIVPCNKDDVQHLDESERKLAKHSESKKRRYMQLKRGSKALTHFYMKLLAKNRNWQLPTDVDRPNDYYSTGQTLADESAGAHHNITDEDSDSKEEYHEICSDSEEKRDIKDKSAFEYVPMLSLSQMYKGASVELETPAQNEYLNILPPNDLQMANSLPRSGKRESDYLNPVETNLPSFPKNFGGEASDSYDEELPEPPKECEMLATEREDERNGIPLNPVGLDSRECRCEKDLVCTKCLKNPSITIDNEIKPKDKGKDVREQESDKNFEYMRMGGYDNKSDNTDVRTEVTRNSEGYAIPLKKYKKTNTKDRQNVSEELNKRLLKQKVVNAPSKLYGSVDHKRSVPNESDAYDSMMESRREVTIHENGTKCLASPQNRRKIKENEKLSYKTSSHFDKQESTLCEKDSFSECKKLFENKATKDKDKGKTFPRAVLSKSSSNSKEDKLHFKTDGDEVGKLRSESCPAESSTGVSPNLSFLKSLESALKLANDSRSKAGTEKKSCTSEFVQDKENKHVNIEMENSYELDYENIRSPTDSDYENNEIYSNDSVGSFSGPRSSSDEFEYDYVNNEKQRKSLHLYEAVSKNSELDEDDYENI